MQNLYSSGGLFAHDKAYNLMEKWFGFDRHNLKNYKFYMYKKPLFGWKNCEGTKLKSFVDAIDNLDYRVYDS